MTTALLPAPPTDDDLVRVLLLGHPLRLDVTHQEHVAPGESIFEMLGCPEQPPRLVAIADGDIVEWQDWDAVRPERLLVLQKIPGDSGTVRLLGLVLIGVAAAALGGWAAAGYSGLARAFVAGGVAAATALTGRLCLNLEHHP